MLTLRIHLDEAEESNGPLRVIPGSHRHGELSPEEVREFADRVPEVACTGRAGSVLILRPLLLHASSPAKDPAHRRVLHLEYAGCNLPSGLAWPSRSDA
jgi:ectoine hydroxylase-related dioxygenase (phytanoyl-CoA dioxygenase family)